MSLVELFAAARHDAAACIVSVDGQSVEELYPLLTEVTVENSRRDAAVATLRFETFRDDAGRYAVQDAGVFEPWAPISIEADLGGPPQRVLSGYVRQVTAEHPRDTSRATVTVTCQDRSIALDREQVRRTWGSEERPTSDLAIITEIVGRHRGLVLVPGSGVGGRTGLIGVNQDGTDITFLRRRAEENHFDLVLDGGSLYLGRPRLEAAVQPTILVDAGRDTHVMELTVEVDAHAPEAVAFDVTDERTGGSRSVSVGPDLPQLGPRPAARSTGGLAPFVWRLSGEGGADEAQLRARARSRANEAAMRVRAEGELDGGAYAHVLRVGEPVGVDGIGSTHSGVYYVDEVTHRFDDTGYRQRFVLLRNAFGDDVPTVDGPLALVL
jgi:phage protein D